MFCLSRYVDLAVQILHSEICRGLGVMLIIFSLVSCHAKLTKLQNLRFSFLLHVVSHFFCNELLKQLKTNLERANFRLHLFFFFFLQLYLNVLNIKFEEELSGSSSHLWFW